MVIPAIPPITSISSTPTASATAPAASSGGESFSSAITNAVDSLQQSQEAASSAEAQSAAGQGNLADTMIAASEASLETEVTTSLLDKATTSYNEIMNMTF